MRTLASLLCLCTALMAPLAADDQSWPRFRGHDGTGVSDARDVPVELNQDSLAWSVPLPGPGSSSPVVWGARVFVTAELPERGEVALVCLAASDGKKRWQQVVKTGSYRAHKMNNAAAPSPCVSKEAVVISWFDAARGIIVLSAYRHDGEFLWKQDVGDFKGQHGPSLQPEIHEGRVIVAHLCQENGYVAALDVKTGKTVWRRDYPGRNPKTTYITPLVRKRIGETGPGMEVVVASTSIGVRGLDFATGEETWALPDEFHHRCIVSPFDILAGSGKEDALVVVGCKDKVFFAVRPPDVSGKEVEVAWRLEKSTPYVPTPVSDGRTVYVLSDGGMLQAVDAMSGKVRWMEKLPANFYASPLLIGGKLYCKSRAAEVFVAEVGGKFKLLATSDLKPGPEVTWADATPAVAHDSLFVRVGARMDCYRAPK